MAVGLVAISVLDEAEEMVRKLLPGSLLPQCLASPVIPGPYHWGDPRLVEVLFGSAVRQPHTRMRM